MVCRRRTNVLLPSPTARRSVITWREERSRQGNACERVGERGSGKVRVVCTREPKRGQREVTYGNRSPRAVSVNGTQRSVAKNELMRRTGAG